MAVLHHQHLYYLLVKGLNPGILTKHFEQDGAFHRPGDVVVVGQASKPARRVLPLKLGDRQRVLDRPGEGLLVRVVQELVVQVPQHIW